MMGCYFCSVLTIDHTCANDGHSPSRHAVISTVRDADDCAIMPSRGSTRRNRKSEKTRKGRSSGRREHRHESGKQQKYDDADSSESPLMERITGQ